MCFNTQLKSDVKTLEKRFKAKFKSEIPFIPIETINAFEFPLNPIITNTNPEIIQQFNWGFLPSWVNDITFRTNTLNAKIETLNEKPSFKPYLNQRCLILADAFYEWQWLDIKGKNKLKFKIKLSNNEPFAFAGLYNIWKNSKTNEFLNTYTILTTAANPLMEKIHNSKKRMPFILNEDCETEYLQNGKTEFSKIDLVAESITKLNTSTQLGFDF
jgi:putative SOS response-associated peptidase YedK